MNEEAILLLYNDLKKTYDVGSIDDFKNYLMDDNKKQMFFEEVIKPTYNVDDIETFNEVYGLKKKEESTFVAPKKDVELVTEDTFLDTQQTPETQIYLPQNILEPIESEDSEFEASLKTSVTPDQIRNPEEFVVPEMQYKFGKYGFDFEESTTNVLGTDAMRVKVRGTNKDLYVKLDRLWGKKGTSKELEKFLRENKRKESEILNQSQAIVQNQRTIQTDEELNSSIKLFNKESERFVYEANEYAKSKAKLDSIYDSNFSNVSKELIKNNPVLKANYDEWLKESKQLDAKLKEIEGKSKDFKYKGTKLDKIAGDYTAMKAEQGTWWSGFWNEIAGGSGPTFTPISSLIDLGTYLDEKMIMGDDTDASVPVKTRKEEYKKDIIRIAKEKGLAPEGLNEDMSLDEVVKALGGDTNDVKLFFDSIVTKGFLNTPSMARARAMKTGSTKGGTQEKEETNFDIVQDKLLDIERKTKKYYEPKVDPSDPEGKRLISARERAFTDAMSDDPKFRNPFSVVGAQKDNFGNEGMVSAGRDSFNFLKDKSTTEQWAEVQKQGNFLKKGFLGLGGSLPAMLGTSTPVGWAQRTAQMYNMSTDYVDQEMEKNPMFDKISEAEKTLVKMPIGVATAVLENIGLRNIISQKGLLNSLVSKALRKSNKNTTAKTFQEFIRQDIESMIGRGALIITGAGLAEFETGLAQEISTIGIKDVYNASKESKMFETPETFATYMSQVVEAGLAEMVGGFVMGSIPAVSAAVKGLQVQNLDPKVFEIFENTIQEPTLKSAYISGLKNRIADPSNELDAKEAQEELDLVNKLEGIMIANRIPFDEFNTNQRKEALQLLMQKETLDNQIEGADKVLSKPKQELLDRVNKRLEELTGESIATQEESDTEAEGITQFDSNLEEGEKIVEEAAGLDVTTEAEVELAPYLLKPLKKHKTAYKNDTLKEADRRGIISYALDKKSKGKRLTGFENTILSTSNQETVIDIQILIEDIYNRQRQRQEFDQEVADLEAFVNQTNPQFQLSTKVTTENKKKELEAEAEPEAELEAEVEEGKIVEGEVGDTFTSNRGTEVIIKKTKNLTVTESENETVDPADEKKFGLKETTKIYQQIYGVRMNGTDPVPKLNIYPNTSITIGKKIIKKAKAEVKLEEQEDITEFFKDELGDSISPNLSINKEGKPENLNNLKPRIIKIAKASAKAIAKLLPKTKIVLHESKSEYFKYTGTKGRGYYDTTTDTIHIDLTNAKLSTVPHEVFHAVFLNKLKTDAKARAMAIKMVESVKKTLSKNSKLYKEIDAFSKLYTGKQEQFQEEEFIAELIGLMSSQEFKNYKQLKAPAKYAIVEFLKKIAKKFGIKLGSEFGKDDQSVIDLINVLATKTVTGEEITEGDVDILNKIDKELDVEQEQGESGQVGTFTFEGRESKAPNIDTDTRAYAKNTIQKDLRVYEGQNFVTNMYDFTDSGKKDIGGGIVLDLYGGKNYVALMMEKTGTKPGQVSNLAAFNSKENAEGFIKNAIEGDANLFSPHVGTKEGSWQFQQNIFAQLTEKLLDNNIITNKELIESFNSGLTSKDGKSALKTFTEAYSKAQSKEGSNLPKLKNTNNLNDFIENPKKLVELLDIDNNYSPDLRKILNDKIAANDKVKNALGVKNKIQFAEKLEDPMNVGSKPFDLIGVIEFDNTTFEAPSRPKKGDADYHPSFAWTVKAKIKAIVQPTNFYQSTEVTDSYTKFNKDEVVVSTKTDLKDSKGNSVEKLYKIALKDTRKYRTNKQGKKVIASGKAPFSGTFEDFQKARFKSSNVSSSAGSGPKVATVKSKIIKGREQQDAPQSRKQENVSEKVKQEIKLGKLINPTRISVRGIDISDLIFAQSYGKDRTINSNIKSLKSDIEFAKKLSTTDKINTTRLRLRLIKNIDIAVGVFEKEAKLIQSKLIKKDGSLNNRASEKIKDLESRIDLLENAKNIISENLFSPSDLKITDTPQSRKQQDAPSIREQKSVSELESNLEKKYDVTLDLYQNKDFLELDKIIVTEDQRNTGVGSNVMREVIDFANKKGLTIALTPSTSYGATSIDRLKGFYKGLGFVENKGINKDFTTKQSMLKLPEVKGRESKIPVTIPADLDQQIDELKVRIEVESVIEFEKDKAGKEAYTKKFFDNYQLLKDELKTLELLKEGLVPAYSQRVTLAEKLNDLNKPFMKEVGNEFYPRQGTVKKGKKIKEDKDLGGVFEVDASGYLFRGVSRADFNRVRSTGIIDTDLRGAISEKEGINLAPNASTAFNYLPEGVEGVVMAIKVDKDMDLFMIGADDYVRSAKPIPYQNVKVITTPTIEGRYLEIKNNEVFKLRDYSVNKEVQVNPKKEKTIYDIADSYYYNNGYFEAKPAPDLIYLRREVESVPGNYSVKKDSTGGLFLTQNNRIKKNLSRPKGREQKSTQQIINEGRQANFKESNIRDFLVRVLNRPAKEVDELMSLDKDFLEVVPKSFTNIKGGIKAGTKLYNRVEAYRKKLVKKNDKLKDNKKLTKTQIVDKTIEYLQKQPEYINEGDKYTIGSKKKGTQETRVRKGFSTQQARMLADYTNTAGVRPTNNMGAKIRKAMAAVRQKVKGARDLQKQKTALRNFIRQSLPKALYTEKDAIDLVNKVNDVNAGNIENLMKEVIEFVNKTNVKSLQAQIKSILNKKYSKVENGIKKPVKISDDIRKRIDFINSLILNEKSTPAQIGDALIDLQNRFNQLAAEVNQTEDTRSEMVDLELAMMYINTLQFKDTNETKVEQLDNIVQTLKEMIEDGRSQLREQIREQHLYYLQQFELGYEAITGNKIDMNDPEASDELNKMKKIFENEKAKRDTQNVIKKFLRSLKEGIDRKAFGSAEDLFSLMDRLDKLPGEMYGGNLQEMFTERVDEASRLFKGRMMLVEQLIQEHLKEVYGKNWKKQSRQNRLAKDTGIMIQDGLPLSPKSQNQIAYLYNLYKDPANKKSFANPEMYGIKTIPKDATKAEKEAIQAINEQNAERIMNEMTALLDPKVKETADWQVNELYPFLYNHYNDAYKKLYRTDLPWNEFYSGTIYREGVDQEEASILDLQNSGNIYSTAVGASGTKVRENSNKAIQTMDMMDVLNTYLNQMEYFSAYGEVVRDMSKLFNNKYISDAITNIHGKDVYKYTLAIIDKIASRGTSTSFGNTFINAMNNVFILSRLAISPVIMIKQLTSFITYANDIGPLNYLKYAAKNKVQMMSVYKEIRDNSVYMKDRQSQSIMRAIETYSDANMRKFVPAGAKDWIVNFAMWTTKFGDKSAIYIGGMPNYSYYKAQFKKKNPEATEQEAIDHAVRLFERDTKRTQQSGDLQDKDYYQTKDPLYRGLNMFLTTPKQYLRKEIVAIRNLNRKLSQWDSKAGKGTVAENLRTFFMYHVIMPVFFQYVSMGLPGILRDERDDDKLDLLRAAMIGNLNALFIVGDLFQMAGDFFTGKPWAGSNIKTVGILSIAGALTEKFAYAGKLKDPTKKSEAYQKAYLELATLTGVAAPTIAKFVENYGNIGKDGDIGKDILRLLNFSKYQIEGPGKGGRPKKIKTIQELNEEYDKKKAKEQKSITGSSNIFGPSTRRKSKSSSKIF